MIDLRLYETSSSGINPLQRVVWSMNTKGLDEFGSINIGKLVYVSREILNEKRSGQNHDTR